MTSLVGSRRSLWLAGLLMLGVQSALADSVDDPNLKIHAMVQQLNAEPSGMARYTLASDISRLVQATEDKTQLRVETIDEIAGLLDDRPASMWAAGALGQIGPAAGRAVPSLEAALDRELAVEQEYSFRTGVWPWLEAALDRKLAVEQEYFFRTGVWPSDVICTALKKIDGAKRSECLIP